MRVALIRVDLHIHTRYSFDATIYPKSIVEQLQANPLIKAAAITDHNTVKGYYKVRELASGNKDILIIPGVEISAIEGDIIVLGIAELPPQPWTVKNVVDFAKERGGLVVAAHPYREYGVGDLAKNYNFDAIEVLNGNSTPYLNRMAENLAREMGLPGVGGSDAHNVDELWTAYTEIQASLDIDEILEALRKGNVKAYSMGKSIHF